MPHIIHQEAGSAYDSLGERLDRIAAETAPLVRNVTQLDLPEPVVIRTMKVPHWKKAHRRASKDQLKRESREIGASSQSEAKRIRRQRLFSMRILWPTMLGQAVELEPGKPELLILPEALQLAGRLGDDPVLYKILAHEMTHLAQYCASGGAVWAAQDTLYPSLRGTEERDYSFLLEGHAYWADRQVTAKLFGKPVSTDEPSPDASSLYLKMFKSPLRSEAVERDRRSLDSVTSILEATGAATFNRVWTDPDLTPLKSETSKPELWEQRMT
ncbi:hypothetical protein ABZ439_26980 [Streptomyces sp. NPDC005840]|uniref:hypothetical protein n=1 Tax=Streptomyces sp. NPDC005840 TaxID=3157072 RepID=UPI0033FCBD24